MRAALSVLVKECIYKWCLMEDAALSLSHDLISEKRTRLCRSERCADVQHFRRRTDVQSTHVGTAVAWWDERAEMSAVVAVGRLECGGTSAVG